MVMAVPTPPEFGLDPEIDGGTFTVKESVDVASPPTALTVMASEIAPLGTVADVYLRETVILIGLEVVLNPESSVAFAVIV